MSRTSKTEVRRTSEGRTCAEWESTTETDALNVNIVLTTQHSSDPCRYNAPSVPEIAAIIPDNVRKQTF